MGENNLIPQSERTKEEQRVIARAGGIASGIARREKRDRVRTLMAAFNVEPLDAEIVRELDATLLAMTNSQLQKVAQNAGMPTYVKRRARLLMEGKRDDMDAFDIAERMLDRAFGKPKQAVDLGMAQAPPQSVITIEQVAEE